MSTALLVVSYVYTLFTSGNDRPTDMYIIPTSDRAPSIVVVVSGGWRQQRGRLAVVYFVWVEVSRLGHDTGAGCQVGRPR